MKADKATSPTVQQLYIDGRWLPGVPTQDVRDRWSGETIGAVAVAGPEKASAAVDAAERAMNARFPIPERAQVLRRAADLIRYDAERFAQVITAETGKPITAARGEVARGIETVAWAAEEAKRLPGEAVQLDAIESGAGTLALTVPVPLGVVAAVTPFNFPLNLVLHKVAPAVASGCAVVLKPSEKAVLAAGLLVEVFERAGLPAGRLNLVTGSPSDIVDTWLADPRVAVLNFTGSSAVGWALKTRSPKKRHLLELGSNTAMVVTDRADLERAADDAMSAALTNSGQACVSLQRIYVTRDVADSFLDKLAERFAGAPVGDPHADATLVGPLITEEATQKLLDKIRSSVRAGARVVTGGESDNGVLRPTIMVDVDQRDPLVQQEAFGPVVSVIIIADLDEAITAVNEADYALNTAIYTSEIGESMAFAERAEAGSVLINMPPSYRADHMPYGGVKGSGQGTEGVKYAIEELLHRKLVVLKP